MNLGDILDGAMKLYRANARAVIAVSAVCIAPLQLLAALAGRAFLAEPATEAIEDLFEGSGTTVSNVEDLTAELVAGLAVVAALPFVAGAASLIVARAYLGGSMTAGEALRGVGRRWWALGLSWVLVHLVSLAGLLACILPGLLLYARFVAVAPAVVVEGLGPLGAMRRSARLARRRLWPVLGVVGLAWILDAVVSASLAAVFDLASIPIPQGWTVRVAGATLVNIVTTPFVAIVATLIYFDLRIRKEGFDIQVMADDVARRARS